MLNRDEISKRLLRPAPQFVKEYSPHPDSRGLARNFSGVGTGWRIRHGAPVQGEQVLRIYVRTKFRDPGLLGPFHVHNYLKDLIDGHPMDVVETGWFRGASSPAGPLGPPTFLGIGADVQMAGRSSHGTLCAFVSTGNDNTPHLLSCGHVLDGHDSEEPLVISQGLVVAKVSKQDQLLPDGFSNPSQTDSSRASLLQGVLTSRDLPDGRGPLGSPEPLKAELGMTVWKVGRNVSVGTVMDTGADVRVDFDALTTVLKNQILVQGSGAPFAQPGDSGALVIAEFGGQRRAVGMICAAGGGSATAMVVPSSQPNWAAVTPMQNVLERLSATLLI